MEAKKMVLKDSKGEENDVDWTGLKCLADAAVAMAAWEEELEKERVSLKEGFKKTDVNAVNNFPYFSEKSFVINRKNPSLTNENHVNNKPLTFSVDDIQAKTITGDDGFMNQGLLVDARQNPTTFKLLGTEIPIGEGKTNDEVSSENPFPDLSKKQSSKAEKQERVNLKRCFESGETSTTGAKKPKLKEKKQYRMGIFGPNDPQPGLPERLKEMIKGMEGTDEKLIIQKPLFKTDLNDHHTRLSIPMNQVKVEFLTDEEKNILKKDGNAKNLEGVKAMVIDPSLKTRDMTLKRWDMNKPSGKTCIIYNLVRGWSSVVKDNDLKQNDVIQLWSFRVNSKLCFALVIVRKVEEERR